MFEGKVIKFVYLSGRKMDAIVVACTKDIGITIVDKNNKDFILFCLNMKKSPNFSHARGAITKTNKSFTKARKQIISGIFLCSQMTSAKEQITIDKSTCPFGQ